MRDGMIFYKSFYDSIKELPKKERLLIYDAIMEYSLYDKEPELSGIVKSLFTLIKPQIDANNHRRDNGNKGGRPKQSDNQTITKAEPNVNQIETKDEPKYKDKYKEKEKVNVKDNVKEKEKGKEVIKQERLFFPEDEILNQTFKNYVENRKAIKSPMTENAIDLAIKHLMDLSGGDHEKAIAILNQSIENGWKGLFDLKQPIRTTDSKSRLQQIMEA